MHVRAGAASGAALTFFTSGSSAAQEAKAGSVREEAPVQRAKPEFGASFREALRQQQSFLAPAERACLHWLAGHTPSWITPDHLTLLGLAAMLLAGVCYWLALWWPPSLLIVNLWLAVNWLGDSLDGTLARFRDKQRPRYGFYVDHIVDAFGSLFLIGGLALSGYMNLTIAAGVLIAYSLLSINAYLAAYTIGTFKLSYYKFSPTELRILLALGNAVAFFHPKVTVLGAKHSLFDVGGTVAMALMLAIVVVSVARNTVTLYRAEKV
ncbi:MAG TPA: hypothetical protein VJH03_07725 [Blastocatellia bacterium]|nr:hypothetical protein [Blastocatellia bacterium]